MSYDLNLYLKYPPVLKPEAFQEACKIFGLTAEPSPDFIADGSLSPLCCKLGGFLKDDPKAYLAVVEYVLTPLTEETAVELPAPRRKWWQFKKTRGETLIFPAGGVRASFSCGIDSLEKPLALLIAYALAGEDGLLTDPQTNMMCIGQTEIALPVQAALNELNEAPPDRLLLHEFDGWL